MRKSPLLLAAAMGLVSGSLVESVRADFVVANGNAAFVPSFSQPQFFSYSNATKPYGFNTSAGVTGAESNLWTDVSNYAGNSSAYGSSPVRAFKWGFRNAGGSNGGTAGKGLSNTAGGHSGYAQTYTNLTSPASIAWTDIFETSRSRIDATISYTLTDGANAGQAILACVATFKNRAANTETYDFFNLVDSAILGIGGGANDAVTASVNGDLHTIGFSDTVSGNPYGVNFTAVNPTRWEVNVESQIQSKTFSGAGNTPTSYIGTGGSDAGVIAAATGDRFGGFQWRVQLAPNETTTLTSYIAVNSVVPEPASLGLLAAVMPLIGRRRRA